MGAVGNGDDAPTDEAAKQVVDRLERVLGIYLTGHRDDALAMLRDMVMPDNPESYFSFVAIGGSASGCFRSHGSMAGEGMYWTIATPIDAATGEQLPIDEIDASSRFALQFVVAVCNDDMDMTRALHDALASRGREAYMDGLVRLFEFTAACIQAQTAGE